MLTALPAGFLVVVYLAGLLILVLWLLLPFSVFGTKPLLRRLIAEQKKTNELLEQQGTTYRRPQE